MLVIEDTVAEQTPPLRLITMMNEGKGARLFNIDAEIIFECGFFTPQLNRMEKRKTLPPPIAGRKKAELNRNRKLNFIRRLRARLGSARLSSSLGFDSFTRAAVHPKSDLKSLAGESETAHLLRGCRANSNVSLMMDFHRSRDQRNYNEL